MLRHSRIMSHVAMQHYLQSLYTMSQWDIAMLWLSDQRGSVALAPTRLDLVDCSVAWSIHYHIMDLGPPDRPPVPANICILEIVVHFLACQLFETKKKGNEKM